LGALCGAAQPVADAVEVEAPLGEPVDMELPVVTPLIRPIVTNRPPTASASRQGARTSPPMLSTTMSTPASPIAREIAAPNP